MHTPSSSEQSPFKATTNELLTGWHKALIGWLLGIGCTVSTGLYNKVAQPWQDHDRLLSIEAKLNRILVIDSAERLEVAALKFNFQHHLNKTDANLSGWTEWRTDTDARIDRIEAYLDRRRQILLPRVGVVRTVN